MIRTLDAGGGDGEYKCLLLTAMDLLQYVTFGDYIRVNMYGESDQVSVVLCLTH